ncbi:M4 family metallopeptidase [Aquabacterium sp.]|uniref:M4 family metallopeptidase n=1 Tax=Aquabacterium sp. TaxID=1872578 RepID=UPI002BBE1380|nr:M4 family metallopeptidase [Aquabacterium sp.]HSW07956.1 M4 family metallopeptidase [Aquabacterium sp.]
MKKTSHATRHIASDAAGGTISAAAVLLLLAAAGTSAAAADTRAATARALAHVQAFPQRTQHAVGHSYELRDVVVDTDGTEHVRFQRRFKGLRVLGGDLVTHTSRSGAFLNASHSLVREPRVDGAARIGAVDALRAAVQAHRGAPDGSSPELVVYARGDLPQLAYDVRLYGEQDDGTPSELHVIVGADRGEVLESWDDVHTAPANGTGQGFFNGSVALTTDLVSGTYSLRDPSRGNQATLDMKNRQFGQGAIFTDTNNAWGDGTLADRQTVGVDAQYGTAMTWDYYKNVHGRNGIANDGKGANNRVHYGRKYNNAFWSDSCFCMTYGDGDGVSFNPFDSLDVAGHEMSHGVTSRTAGLVYSGESGGLNEGTSDIFGTMVEYYANNPNDTPDYRIGEELYKNGSSSLRTMINPSTDGKSADCWYSGVGNLDVHYSSGVANHFYFLLAEGTTAGSPSKTCVAGNTRVATGTGTLAGIGRAKAEKIWYRALTVYMTSSTTYAGARAATIGAANDLYGAGSPESTAVAAAWTAVGRN